jgi:tubulin polyglutamylase TTLL4
MPFHARNSSNFSLIVFFSLNSFCRWKLSNITPAVVKRVVTNSGFRLMRKTCSEWGGTWGKHMKSDLFKELHEGQKINHLPGTFNIGRKDRLWKNYHKLRLKFGKDEFSFLPRTFCLPSDTKLLKKVWEKQVKMLPVTGFRVLN